ncbi:MAG: putative sulfate exporter family transporter [Acidobacteria bacterium]|nr:putative sulfate exporter family transporter [Acidobacteriota bacterium]
MTTLETVTFSEIFNITRVSFLPFLLIILAFSASSRQALTKADSGKRVLRKFPMFTFGFWTMTALTSIDVFRAPRLQKLRSVMLWCFSVGLISLGMLTDLEPFDKLGEDPC